MSNVLDCSIVLCEFEPQSRNYVHVLTNTLGKDMNSLTFLLSMGEIVLVLFFDREFFGIK